MRKNRVLIIDRDLQTCKDIKYNVDSATTEAYYTLTVREGLAELASKEYDLVILNVCFPEMDDMEVLKTLRGLKPMPILILSTSSALADKLQAFKTGADDYLTKPFLMQELLLRVQHILQRAYRADLSRTKSDALRLGGRSVDLNDALVTLPDGSTLALTATELALLRKLAENRGHIVTYDALCTAVWGADYYGYENSLNVHIRHLREKLEEQPSRPQHLLTVRSIGYKLAKEETA